MSGEKIIFIVFSLYNGLFVLETDTICFSKLLARTYFFSHKSFPPGVEEVFSNHTADQNSSLFLSMSFLL